MSIVEINPFSKIEEEIQSPTFQGNASEKENLKNFSFEIGLDRSQKQSRKNYEEIIDELKDVNEKLKENLFESYQKYNSSLEGNHQEIKSIQQQNSDERKKLSSEVEVYRIKWMSAQKKCQEHEE